MMKTSVGVRIAVRYFNANAKVPLTTEQIAAGLEKNRKWRKFNDQSSISVMIIVIPRIAHPQSLTRVLGTGADLHVPADPTEAAALACMPAEQSNRTVVITQRINKTLQSGIKFVNQWQISWKHSERWTNPLMGWTSTADPMSNLKLTFDTKEAAMEFANRNGWKFEVGKETSKSNIPAGTYKYADNFLPQKVAKQVKLEGQNTKIYNAPGYGKSNWFMPLTYHGDREVIQHGPPAAPAAANKSSS